MRSNTQGLGSAGSSTRSKRTSPAGDTSSATPGGSSRTASVGQSSAAWIAGRSEATATARGEAGAPSEKIRAGCDELVSSDKEES